MKNTYKLFRLSTLIIGIFFLSTLAVNAQDEGTEQTTEETPKERPVRPAFESGLLFDASTTTLQPAKTLEMIIQHRFGVIDFDDDKTDFLGIWGGSNIRIGMNYSILNNLTIGVGATKFNQMEDIQLKYRIIEQTRSNSIPVTAVLYGVVGIDGSDKHKWDATYDTAANKHFHFANRMSYFTQLIVSRRFNDHLSLQVAPGFVHYNCVDSVYDHDRFTLSFAGRYKFTPQGSFIISADVPMKINSLRDYKLVKPNTVEYWKPNICVGFEVSTSTHAFHIYLASAQGILPQEDVMWNQNDFASGGFLIGLNVTRLWSF